MTGRSSGRAFPFARLVALFAAAAALLGCGKVGDPLPPFIGVPQPAVDFRVEQAGYRLLFSWTNPLRNIDQSEIAGLERVLIFAGDELLADVPVSGPGQRQMLSLGARDRVGSDLEFAIRFRTREGELSALSNTASIEVLALPGPGPMPRANVDQGRVLIEWEAPIESPIPADAYRVYRSGEPVSDALTSTRFEDIDFTEGEHYTYTVVPLRQSDTDWVEGFGYESVSIVAIDRVPPSPPTGLILTRTERGAFLQWDQNPEADVVRYRAFRREGAGAEFEPVAGDAQTTTAFFDAAYRPGYEYAVSAVDRAGNESERSAVLGRE